MLIFLPEIWMSLGAELIEVDGGFDDAVGHQHNVAVAVPFDVVEHHDFFKVILDGDELGEGLDFLEERRGVENDAGP